MTATTTLVFLLILSISIRVAANQPAPTQCGVPDPNNVIHLDTFTANNCSTPCGASMLCPCQTLSAALSRAVAVGTETILVAGYMQGRIDTNLEINFNVSLIGVSERIIDASTYPNTLISYVAPGCQLTMCNLLIRSGNYRSDTYFITSTSSGHMYFYDCNWQGVINMLMVSLGAHVTLHNCALESVSSNYIPGLFEISVEFATMALFNVTVKQGPTPCFWLNTANVTVDGLYVYGKEVEILSVGPVITIATSSFQLLTRIDASNIHVANNSFSVAFLDNFDSNVEISFTNSTFNGNSITTAVGSLINAPRGFSTLSLQACSFSHNEGASSVAKVKGTVSQLSILISQCSFRNNSIAGYDSQGAALHVDVSAQLNMTLDHSVFEYNSAGAAGAVYIRCSDCDDNYVVHRDCVYRENRAIGLEPPLGSHNGGALGMDGMIPGVISFSNTLFIENEASFSGGAVFLSLSKDTVVQMMSGTTFLNNNALLGGAVFSTQVTLETSHAHFYNNSADSGGALFVATVSRLDFKHSEFRGNSAFERNGGALIITDSGPQISFSDCVFSRNHAAGNGGACYFGNAASGMQGCQFTENSAHLGGALYVENDEALSATVNDCRFERNNGTYRAGGVLVLGLTSFRCSNTSFDTNQSPNAGALYFGVNSTASLANATINGNSAVAAGGAMVVADLSDVSMLGCSVTNNSAKFGGAIVILSRSNLYAKDCLFERNFARVLDGGAIKIQDNARAVLVASSFEENVSAASGAAVSFVSQMNGTVISNCIFTANYATGEGSVYLSTTTTSDDLIVVLSDNVYSRNIALNGGGVYCTGKMRVEMSGSQFHQCKGSVSSGLCIAIGSTCDLRADSLLINGTINAAEKGGGIAVMSKSSRLRLTNSIIRDCIAMSGGGLYSVCALVFLENVIFTKNVAYDAGGGAMIHQCPIQQLVNCSFEENFSVDTGGGVYIAPAYSSEQLAYLQRRSPDYLLTNCSFTGNIAVSGGAVFQDDAPSATLAIGPVAIMNGNEAGFGGGIFINEVGLGHIVQFHGVSFDNNRALFAGSTIFVTENQSNAYCAECMFGDNNVAVGRNGVPGYQDGEGLAAMPQAARFLNGSGCPSHQYLGQEWSISVYLEDSFGTKVDGDIFSFYEYNVTLSSSECIFMSPNPVRPFKYNISTVTFADVSLNVPDNTACTVIVSVSGVNAVQSLSCSITVSGCAESGQVVVDDASGNAMLCQKAPFWTWEKILLAALICFTILLMVIVLVFLAVYVRRRFRRIMRMRTELPDYLDGGRKPRITLEELKADPNIKVIDWEEITILDVLGRGASGVVYKAEWREGTRPPKLVALKEYYGWGLDDMTEGVALEIKLTSALQAPEENIVEMYGISFRNDDDNDSNLVLVLELMSRGSVRHILNKKSGNIPWKLRLGMLVDAAKGLEYLHARRVIHRDIKPENLLVDQAWRCKIADLGESIVKPDHTIKMTEIGTVDFMAPEVIRGDPYNQPADIWSFGIMMIELTCGIMRRQLHPSEVRHEVLSGRRPPYDCLPNNVQELITDCLRDDPKLRPSAEELLIRLKRLAGLNLDVEMVYYHSFDFADADSMERTRKQLELVSGLSSGGSVVFSKPSTPEDSRSTGDSDLPLQEFI